MNRRILGWAVPTNPLGKLHYLSDALPTLHQLKPTFPIGYCIKNPRVGSAYQPPWQASLSV
ncbi:MULTISPECIES: hypothetical protein [unclassified Moorena]|uniref:hypothetical protein n=1 Tax=unclassified Moorena TaxID=2683338 RepID=UPI0013BCB559|nr:MULTISPECIES: hypothetical protein [unclassified Moorena]NEQ17882.1 hypothetical protein [Moorena sp. SIO3E2]NEP67296.1 hypothetical protein [Moorena sp. SIO3A5]NEQ05578.1 hypothetical protein [Moorena sp. SIO4E2]NER86522.1 hypothetical protein [Moorena sp. SIO3A2]NES42845.1 hypothetical protein [Moorena sp. SIO2C4]